MNYIIIGIYYIKFVIMDEIVSSNEIRHIICLFWCSNDRGHPCRLLNYINIQKLDDHTVIFDIIHITSLNIVAALIFNIKTKSNFSLSVCKKDDFDITYTRYKLLVELEEILNYNFNNITYNKYCIYIGDQIIIYPGSLNYNNSINYCNTNNLGLILTCKDIGEFINLSILQKYRIDHSKTICTCD